MSTPENPQPKHVWFADAYLPQTLPVEPPAEHEVPATTEAPAPVDRVAEDVKAIRQQFNSISNSLTPKIIDGENYEGFSWRTRRSKVTGASAQIDLFRKVDEAGNASDIIEGSLKSKSDEREIRLFTLNTSEGIITGPNGDDETARGIAIDLERYARCEYHREVIREEAPSLARSVAILGVAGFVTLAVIGYLQDSFSDKGMTAAEYAQSYDQENYLLNVPPFGLNSAMSELSGQTFDAIPPYKPGDSLVSPRTYNFKLEGEKCKTFVIPSRDTSYDVARLAVKQGEQYKNGSSFGVIYGEGTLSVCRTNPERQEKKDSSDVAQMGIAIQLPDHYTEMRGKFID